jgi:hypothetical protein
MKFNKGDYVIATMYQDGDPFDPWCVGFYDCMSNDGRHFVEDNDGKQFRPNGFRRCKRISWEVGHAVLATYDNKGCLGKSIYTWIRDFEALPEEEKAFFRELKTGDGGPKKELWRTLPDRFLQHGVIYSDASQKE